MGNHPPLQIVAIVTRFIHMNAGSVDFRAMPLEARRFFCAAQPASQKPPAF
jgi:hypothetical protein